MASRLACFAPAARLIATQQQGQRLIWAVGRPAVRHVSAQAAQAFIEPQTERVPVYTAYTVYKGKSAMSVKMIPPRWEKVASGLGVSQEGKLLLEFANARAEREYDWQSKESFSLSATECADLLEGLERGEGRSLFHDPNKMREGEGTITKSFSIAPNDAGFFFNLAVKNVATNTSPRFSTPLSRAEARTLRIILNFAVPRLLGMDEIFAGPPDVAAGAPPPPF
eukprot:scaffold20.g7722.t1